MSVSEVGNLTFRQLNILKAEFDKADSDEMRDASIASRAGQANDEAFKQFMKDLSNG